MCGIRYAWAMAAFALCGMMATAGWAEVSTTGDTKDSGSTFYAGYNADGIGTLTVDVGSVFDRSTGFLGYAPGSMGTAVVTGTGSKWTNSGGLWVGSGGSGTLTVADGGLVSAKTLYASLSDLYGNGAITTSGAVLDAQLIFDSASSGTLAFGSGGSLQLTLDSTSTLGVGYKGAGSLRIVEGRSVTSAYGYLGHYSGATGAATITGAGSMWTNSRDLNVGFYGSGSLQAEFGGQVSNRSGYLGYSSGSTGEAIITGAGSKWTNSSELYVGRDGSGTLRVEAGGQISNSNGYLGYNSSSTGTAIVTGAGSKWTNSGELWVGRDGSGMLTVSDGGVVNAKTLYASLSDLYGDGSIMVSGGVVDADLSFDGAHGLTQSLGFGSGGNLQFTMDRTGILGIGYKRSGSLRIADGRSVSLAKGFLGYAPGSTGTAIITGAGSTWTNVNYPNDPNAPEHSGSFYVGYSGSGMLRVEAGALVSNANGYLGYGSGSSGEVVVTGTGSRWTNWNLYVGGEGSGTLDVEAGGQVSSYNGYISGTNTGSPGRVTVTGAGSKWTNSGAFNDPGFLYVGSSGSGTLNVEAGGEVSDTSGYLGYNAGSTGTATIRGAGSKWTNSIGLFVGVSGSGTLNVEAGGQVRSAISYVDGNSGFSGKVTVTGAGSTWATSGNLYLGYKGSGTLTVSDGGQVAAKILSINSQSTARLHVSSDRMLVLGDASAAGSISNDGKLSLLADAFLPAGTYRPVGEYADRSLSWSGSGSTLAVGGSWDGNAKTFTVGESVRVDAGTAADVAGGMRVVIRDVASGERAGVSFGELSSGTTLAGLPLTESERAGLLPLLGSQEMMLSGWDFAGELAGGESLVSFDVGVGAEEVRVWKLGQEGWKAYAPEMMTYDSKGIVSFTVDPAALNGSGYAVSGVVPEPAALGMLMVAVGMGLVRRRRRGNGE